MILAALPQGAASKSLILIIAVITGLLAGILRAWSKHRSLTVPHLNLVALVIAAFIIQLLIFQIPTLSGRITDRFVPYLLVFSLLLLVVFTWLNRRQSGFALLGLGLLLNLAVILLNGGWMPISPQIVERLAPHAPNGAWEIGERLGTTKDMVMHTSNIRLRILSDQFVVPDWFPYRVAFSFGDILISIGAFWFLWSMGSPHKKPTGINY